MPASNPGTLPSLRARITSRALLSWSTFFWSIFFSPPFPGFRERLGIGTLHSRPQAGESAELQLFHRSLSLANFLRHFLDAFLLDKPQHHHPPLLGRQRVHQPIQSGPPFDFVNFLRTRRRGIDRGVIGHFPPTSLPPVRNQVRRNAEQPRSERNPAPLKPFQIRQRLVKHLRSQVFRLRTVLHTLYNVGIHPFEVHFVKLRKAGRIVLRSFDQKPLVRFFLESLQRVLRGDAVHKGNAPANQKVTARRKIERKMSKADIFVSPLSRLSASKPFELKQSYS